MTRRGSGERVELPGGGILLEGHLDTARIDDGIRPLRLPVRHWAHFPPAAEILRTAVGNASGVRIRVRTAATRLELRVRCTRIQFEDLPGPRNRFVAVVDGVAVADALAPVDRVERVTITGDSRTTIVDGPGSTVTLSPLPAGEKTVTVLLPQGMIVDLLDVTGDAPVVAADAADLPVWVHYGSSISHCADPELPTSVWPTRTAAHAGLDLINLGFGGQCMLDPFVADAIAEAPADVISIKVGVNIVGARSMDRRTFAPALHGFIDRVRRGHPDVPLVLVSSILWPGSEEVPGPSDVEFLGDGRIRCFTAGSPADVARGALTMAESRRHVEAVARERAREGEPVRYLDGLSLYGPDDLERWPLPDSLHPDAALYEEIGRRFAALVFGETGLVPRGELG